MRNTKVTVSHEYGNDENLLIDVICEELLGLRRRDLPRPKDFVVETPSKHPEANPSQDGESSSSTAVDANAVRKTVQRLNSLSSLSAAEVKGK